MYSRFQSLSLILATERQQACYIRKGQIIQTIFHFQRHSNCLSSSAQVAHSGSKCGQEDLISLVKLLAISSFGLWRGIENSLFPSLRKRLKFYYSQNVNTFMKKITEFSKLESFYREWCSNQSASTKNETIYRFLDSRLWNYTAGYNSLSQFHRG